MITNLRAYLAIESAMTALDEAGHEDAADLLRDRMDGLWWSLADEERARLQSRDPKAAPTIEVPDPSGGTRLVLI